MFVPQCNRYPNQNRSEAEKRGGGWLHVTCTRALPAAMAWQGCPLLCQPTIAVKAAKSGRLRQGKDEGGGGHRLCPGQEQNENKNAWKWRLLENHRGRFFLSLDLGNSFLQMQRRETYQERSMANKRRWQSHKGGGEKPLSFSFKRRH